MPSNSFGNFKNYLLVDVERIIETHKQINPNKAGKRALGHLTRSGVVMLCAAWQVYMEEVLLEAIEYVISKIGNPQNLPKDVQRELARAVRESKNYLKPLELSGSGWRYFYEFRANEALQGFNTPKSGKIDPMFKMLLGVQAVSDWWTRSKDEIDDFVSIRGEIAHRGRIAPYIPLRDLYWYMDLVYQTALDVDNELTIYLRDMTPGQDRPWKRRFEY